MNNDVSMVLPMSREAHNKLRSIKIHKGMTNKQIAKEMVDLYIYAHHMREIKENLGDISPSMKSLLVGVMDKFDAKIINVRRFLK